MLPLQQIDSHTMSINVFVTNVTIYKKPTSYLQPKPPNYLSGIRPSFPLDPAPVDESSPEARKSWLPLSKGRGPVVPGTPTFSTCEDNWNAREGPLVSGKLRFNDSLVVCQYFPDAKRGSISF